MTTILWQATQVVFWLAVFVAIAAAPWVVAYWWYEDSDTALSMIAVIAGVVWCAIAVVGGIIWIANEYDKADDAAHRWRGGSGPDTHCEFDYRNETIMVGKVATTQRVTYTVCD